MSWRIWSWLKWAHVVRPCTTVKRSSHQSASFVGLFRFSWEAQVLDVKYYESKYSLERNLEASHSVRVPARVSHLSHHHCNRRVFVFNSPHVFEGAHVAGKENTASLNAKPCNRHSSVSSVSSTALRIAVRPLLHRLPTPDHRRAGLHCRHQSPPYQLQSQLRPLPPPRASSLRVRGRVTRP
jgi:hypothetical protein